VSIDDVVKTAAFDIETGTFTVPARTAAVFVLEVPPQERLGRLIDEIESLVEAGRLNRGQGNALTSKLEQAIKHLDRENPQTALNVLNAFQNQVLAYVNGGVLTPEEGQGLLDAVDAIVTQIRLRYGIP
jgi:hypothetical protein